MAETARSIRERIEQFTRGRAIPLITGRTVIITDDGLASGYTMLAAVEALKAEEAERIIIAVPTGSAGAVAVLSGLVDTLVCLNLRERSPFAVAEAYENCYDLDDEEVSSLLNRARKNQLFFGIPKRTQG